MEKRLQGCCLSRLSTEIFQELLLCAELIRDQVNRAGGSQMLWGAVEFGRST